MIKSSLYNFSLNLHKNKDNFSFEIVAFCNTDKTKSSITNLNFIISELIEPIIAFEDYETTLITDRDFGNKVYSEAVKLFNNSKWLNYLFDALEDDRIAGEWS